MGLLTYYEECDGDLKVAHCANVVCSEASNVTVVDNEAYGTGSSIVLGVDGFGFISYLHQAHGLRTADCLNINCDIQAIGGIGQSGSAVGNSSVAIDSWGYALITFVSNPNNLGIVHCSNTECTSGNSFQLDTSGSVCSYNSLTIGIDGFGVVAYYDESNKDLKIANCSDRFCSDSTSINVIDSQGDVGKYPSITIDPYGLPLISYYDFTNGDLKTIHCANKFCVPYYRLR